MVKRALFRETPAHPQRKIRGHQRVALSGQEAWVNTMVYANDQISNYLDRQAIAKGKKEGLKAAKEGEYKETGGTSLYDNAYDAAGRAGYQAAMSNKVSTSMSDIYRANKHDPKLLQDKLEEYEREVIGQAEGVSPEVALQLGQQTARQKLTYLDTSRNSAEAALIDSSAAEVTAGVQSMTSSTMFAVRNMQDRTSAMTFAAQSRAQLEASLVGNGPKEPFADDKSLYLSDNAREAAQGASGERTGALTAKEIQSALKKFDDAIVTEKYMWGMDEAIKAGSGVGFIKMFTANPDPSLTPAQSANIKKNMYAALAEHSKMVTATGEAEKKVRIETHRLTSQAATASALRGELTTQQIISLVETDQMSATEGRTLKNMIKSGGVQVSDGVALMEYQVMGVLDSSEVEIMQDNRLTYADRTKLIKERQTIEADQNDWRNSPSGQEGARRIKGELGIISGQTFMQVSDEKAREASRAMATYWNEVNALPIEKRATEAPKIADRLVGEIKKNADRKELERLETKLEDSPYQSVEAIDKAVADNDPELVGGWADTPKKNVIKQHKTKVERLQKKIEKLKAKVK